MLLALETANDQCSVALIDADGQVLAQRHDGRPLVLAIGEGAELRVPLGIAIVGGLLISQILTLFSTPVIYIMLENWFGTPPATRLASPAAPVPVDTDQKPPLP